MIAYDQPTGKTSIRASSLDIAALDETRPRLSSVSVLKRAERLTPGGTETRPAISFRRVAGVSRLASHFEKSRPVGVLRTVLAP
jgi:hypothetical protein